MQRKNPYRLTAGILRYACENLKDESGIGIAICDEDSEKIAIAKRAGFNIGGKI